MDRQFWIAITAAAAMLVFGLTLADRNLSTLENRLNRYVEEVLVTLRTVSEIRADIVAIKCRISPDMCGEGN